MATQAFVGFTVSINPHIEPPKRSAGPIIGAREELSLVLRGLFIAD
jgi:hypothetical protein